MFVLNLDNSFTPFGIQNQIEYQTFTFSGGEPHIKIQPFDTTQKLSLPIVQIVLTILD
nr:hypothetical protein [Flavobacterium covae]